MTSHTPERIGKVAAAAILGCTPRAVVTMAARGELAAAGAAKIVREWTFDEKRLRAFAETPFKRKDRKYPPPAPKYEYGSVYVVGFQSYVKIGFSASPKTRLSSLQVSLPIDLIVYKIIRRVSAEDERRLHDRFFAYHIRGEWFLKTGDLESWIEAGCPL